VKSKYAARYISSKKECLTTFPNTLERVENTTLGGVFFDELSGVWKCWQTRS